jgi:hypothetical protein
VVASFSHLPRPQSDWTQGDSLDDLKDHLVDLYRDLTSGQLPGIRKIDELVVP